MTNTVVAELERLHDSTVKDLDTLYMRQQVACAGMPAPRAIGVDEISIRKGHTYRVIVSDLDRQRPIWVGGQGRTEADIDQCFAALGERKSRRIRLAVMDMWKPFRNSVEKHAPNTRIGFDKFHIMRHLSTALDPVRRHEYKRLQGKEPHLHQGTALHPPEPSGEPLLGQPSGVEEAACGQQAAQHRLGAQGILSKRGARAFFERWQDSLKWQRLEPYQKFACMIERHWEGIASYCHPDNKVSLGLVEGLNNKIRVLQRRPMAIGMRAISSSSQLSCLRYPGVLNLTHTNPRRPKIIMYITYNNTGKCPSKRYLRA